jgi:hypothetical protein
MSHECRRLIAGDFEDIGIAKNISDLKCRQPGLLRPEELSRTP